MLGIISRSMMTATRMNTYNHWDRHTRFDDRRDAALIAHSEARSDV